MKNDEIVQSSPTAELSLPARVWLWLTNPPTISLPGISSLWLPGIFMLETFLFLPMDLLLAGYCAKNQDEAYPVAIVCAICSTFSAMISYLIGFFAWEQFGRKLLGFLVQSSLFVKITTLYQAYQFPVVFFGGLLPIPTKIITISAGLCKLSLPVFLTAILLARLIRFWGVAFVAKNYGARLLASLSQLRSEGYLSGVLAIMMTRFWK